MTALAYHRLQKGWDLRPLKHIAALNPEVLPEDTDPDWTFPYVDIGNVTFEAGITGTELVRFADAPSRARRRVRNGDTIVSTVRTYLRAIAPVSNQPDGLIASTGFAVVRAKPPTNAGYLSWALRSSTFVEAVVADSVGVSYPAIAPSVLGALPVPVPPPAEQHAIADFLDRETAKIDALIATQERLIALLDEKRQATITHAVTKGLDPTAPMKESGVEWLGEVPANWGVLPLKRCCRIPNGLVDSTVGRNAALPLIAPNHIQSGTGRLLELETADDQGAISGKYHFVEGTVLYSKIRPALRKACVAPFEGLCSADMYPIYSTKITSRLLLYQILGDCFSSFAILASDRVAMPKVNRETIGDFPMVVPPSAEQEVIVRYVDEAVAEIDRLRDRSVEVIERLRERRTALITAAVTGQVDVSHPAITEAAK